MSILAEFNIWSRPEQTGPASTEPVPIPAGYFVNWLHGLRRLVPRSVTRVRFNGLLDRAETGGIVHAWLHPENIASAPETLSILRDIVETVAKRREAGRCVPTTQIDYVRSISSAAR